MRRKLWRPGDADWVASADIAVNRVERGSVAHDVATDEPQTVHVQDAAVARSRRAHRLSAPRLRDIYERVPGT